MSVFIYSVQCVFCNISRFLLCTVSFSKAWTNIYIYIFRYNSIVDPPFSTTVPMGSASDNLDMWQRKHQDQLRQQQLDSMATQVRGGGTGLVLDH